jgi:hypothetical protein
MVPGRWTIEGADLVARIWDPNQLKGRTVMKSLTTRSHLRLGIQWHGGISPSLSLKEVGIIAMLTMMRAQEE